MLSVWCSFFFFIFYGQSDIKVKERLSHFNLVYKPVEKALFGIGVLLFQCALLMRSCRTFIVELKQLTKQAL